MKKVKKRLKFSRKKIDHFKDIEVYIDFKSINDFNKQKNCQPDEAFQDPETIKIPTKKK